jgi:hypothetical protein
MIRESTTTAATLALAIKNNSNTDDHQSEIDEQGLLLSFSCSFLGKFYKNLVKVCHVNVDVDGE